MSPLPRVYRSLWPIPAVAVLPQPLSPSPRCYRNSYPHYRNPHPRVNLSTRQSQTGLNLGNGVIIPKGAATLLEKPQFQLSVCELDWWLCTCCRCQDTAGPIKCGGDTGQNAQFFSYYNSNATEPNFTKHGCEVRLNIVVIPIVLVFPEFLLVSMQQPSEDDGVWIFAPKWRLWAPISFFWGGTFLWGRTINE